MTKKGRPIKGEASQHDLAEFWRVNQSLIKRWVLAGMPPTKKAVTAAWILKNAKRKNANTKEVCQGLLSKPAGADDPEIKPPTTDEEMLNLEQLRDYYLRKVSEATGAEFQDSEQIKLWNDLLLKTEKCIREAQAHEKKLGLEQGETIKREEVERIIDAILFAGNACVRNQIKELCQGISMKTPAEIYKVLPAAILGGRIFEGLAAVVKSDSEVQIPQWMVDRFIEEGENYLKGITT